MTPDFFTHGCPRCGAPEPDLPDPDAVMTWSERHERECAEARKARAA